jgi:hypothetical protein
MKISKAVRFRAAFCFLNLLFICDGFSYHRLHKCAQMLMLKKLSVV